MNLAATIANMEAAGMTPAAIVTALKCIVVDVPPAPMTGAERTAKWRDKKRDSVTSDVTSSQTPPPLVPPLSPAPLSPPIIPPTPAGIGLRDPLETKLREAAGWQSEPAPMLCVTGCVQALIDQGADLEIDVLPTIKALAPKARGRTSWKYFLNAIAQARDDRIAAAKIVTHPNAIRNANGPSSKPSRQDAFAILDAVADATIARTGGGREASDKTVDVEFSRLRESPT